MRVRPFFWAPAWTIPTCRDPALAGTRSGLTVADDGLDHVDVFFYESGSLCESLTISEDAGWNNTFTTRVSLPVGHAFDILVLANAGDVTPAATYTEAVAGLTYVCDGLEDWNRQGLPMAGMTSVTVRPNMGDILVDLTRLVAKLRLSIDISSLQHGSILDKGAPDESRVPVLCRRHGSFAG